MPDKTVREILDNYIGRYYSVLESREKRNDINSALSAIKSLLMEAIPKTKDQYLTTDKLSYQWGWCKGREELRAEIRKEIERIL